MNPAILFEPNGYLLNGPKLMGRQVAGDGFLRAAVKGRDPGPMTAYTPQQRSAEVFAARVRELDPTAETVWAPSHRLRALADIGLLYRPDHALAEHAFARLRVGHGAYSVCGVTHTLSSDVAMRSAAELATAPLAPWDAVVCTSTAGREVIARMIEAQADYLSWRVGTPVNPPRPQLPVIPLGVHPEDFAGDDASRAAARAAIGIADDEVVLLFPGRLSFHSKVNPYALYTALQETAAATGAKLVLLHAGQFANTHIEDAYRSGTAQFCPDVRCLFLDGKDFDLYAQTWQAADIFTSLSDNIQETFGITPIEAMAAGLPVLVTDWNGYKDTVEDGVQGFRIATWQPGPGSGAALALSFENRETNYDMALVRTSTATALDMRQLVQRLTELVTNPDLRRRMGVAGRQRVASLYSWDTVYAQYKALWAELARIRAAEAPLWPKAPAAAPHWRDPFDLFSHYPTHTIEPGTRVTAAPGASVERYAAVTSHGFLSNFRTADSAIGRILAAAEQETTVQEIAAQLRASLAEVAEVIGRLAKMELVHLKPAAD